MMLYKNMKAMVCSSDSDTDFFDSVTAVLQGDILVPYLFMIYLDYILQTSIDQIKENSLTLGKARRQYPAETFCKYICTSQISERGIGLYVIKQSSYILNKMVLSPH